MQKHYRTKHQQNYTSKTVPLCHQLLPGKRFVGPLTENILNAIKTESQALQSIDDNDSDVDINLPGLIDANAVVNEIAMIHEVVVDSNGSDANNVNANGNSSINDDNVNDDRQLQM